MVNRHKSVTQMHLGNYLIWMIYSSHFFMKHGLWVHSILYTIERFSKLKRQRDEKIIRLVLDKSSLCSIVFLWWLQPKEAMEFGQNSKQEMAKGHQFAKQHLDHVVRGLKIFWDLILLRKVSPILERSSKLLYGWSDLLNHSSVM